VKKISLIFLLYFCSWQLFTQQSFMGFSAGLSFDFGNRVNRIGISVSGYYTYYFTQINATLKTHYNFQSLGIKQKTPEIQLGIGAEIGFGKTDSLRNNFIGLTENNLLQRNSFGYAYIRYWDKNQTSQSTGVLSVTVQHVKFVTENDLFAAGKGWRDRFRTGAFLIEYQYLNTKFAINSTFWTGDYTGCDNVYDSEYPARFGYRLSEKAQYGNFSLGLLSLQVNQLLPLPYTQNAQLNIGIDAEQVRNVLQNKLIHDQPFFPKKWLTLKPVHIPMLDINNEQYLYKEGQEIRPIAFYFNLGLNNNLFY